MGAHKKHRLGILIFMSFPLLFLPRYGFCQGEEDLRLYGSYQIVSDVNTGITNPNNAGIQSDRNNFMLWRQKFQIEADYTPASILTLHAQARFFHDFTHNLDKEALADYNAFPRDFNGNGSLLRGGGDHAMAELRELFAEVKGDNWWLRLGKQQVGWGESLGFRVLDQVNPLDLSQQFINQRVYDEFDNIRIPQWMIRGIYKFPAFSFISDLSAEVIYNPGDVVPTILPAQGSPYNPVPAFLSIRENIPRGDPIWGGRLEGTIKEVYLSLNFLSKPVDDAVTIIDDAVPALFPGGPRWFVNRPGGVPLLAGFGDPTLYTVALRGDHPRANLVGGSFSFEQKNWGVVWHGEVASWLDYPYANYVSPGSPFNNTVVDERNVLKLFLGFDKHVNLLPRSITDSSLAIAFQYLHTTISGEDSTIQTSTGSPPYKNDEIYGLVLQQPFVNTKLLLELSYFIDARGSYHFQPGLRYLRGDHWIFDLFANQYGGSTKGQAFGGLNNWANSVFFQVTYGFSEGFKIGK